MNKLEEKAEKIWDKWRSGEITYAEVQNRLSKLLPEPKGFFESLERELMIMTNSNIFSKPENVQAYFLKRQNVRNDLILDSNWVQFFQTCGFLENPKNEDIKALEVLDSGLLADYHILVCQALKRFIENELENSTEALILHQYYNLIKIEINSRIEMPKLPEKDAFLDYVRNKQQYREQENLLEKARVTGSICPHCGSENVRSYGKAEWKCYTCGKRFRKH